MVGLTADDLYKLAAVEPTGTTSWRMDVPTKESGVYVITLDLDPAVVHLVESASDAERGLWWPDQSIVYIGRAGILSRRLRQFRQHVYGRRSPHRGGQGILLLESPKTIRWAVTEHFEAAEDRLIKAFEAHIGRRPFGNRVRSAQTKSSKPNDRRKD